MKTITIRELHQATARWMTKGGQLIAKIVPASPPPAQPFFASPAWTRAFLRERSRLRGGTDSTEIIGEDREVR